MSALTARMLRDMLNELDETELDTRVIIPGESGIPGMFKFEEACPGVCGLIHAGPKVKCMSDNTLTNEESFFLIAPHSFHHGIDDNDGTITKKQETLN